MSDFVLMIKKDKQPEKQKGIFSNRKGYYYCSKIASLEQMQATKFEKDTVFFEKNGVHFSLSGVLLNVKDVMHKNQRDDLEDVLEELYSKDRISCITTFEGSFHGTIIDNINEQILVYTDRLSNHPVYYYNNKSDVIISNKIQLIILKMRNLGLSPQLNMVGAYSMLTYGYMYANYTLIDGIRRLTPGHYLQVQNKSVEEVKYYSIVRLKESDICETDILKHINDLFCEGMALQIQKNKEYSYANIAALSGGLDSRMTVYALKEIGASNVVTFTYAETGQIDQILPQKISKKLGYRWLFKSLDNGLDLMNIEEAISLSDTRGYYVWAAQLNDFLRYIDKNQLGLVHTGVIGDVVIGSFCHEKSQIDMGYKIGNGAYSCVLLNKLNEYIKEPICYDSYEQGMMYNRAFNGACLGYSTVFQNYTEALSPFMYSKLFDFCLSLPPSIRYQHDLYYKWVQKHYPDAAKYSHNGLKIHQSNLYFTIQNKKIYFDTLPSRICGILNKKLKKDFGMNPIQYWYQSNAELKKNMDDYLNKNGYVLKEYNELYQDVNRLYQGSAIDKLLCISLVGSVKQFICQN